MNTHLKQLWELASKDTKNGSFQEQQEFLTRFALLVAKQTIQQVRNTDCRQLVLTTFDRGLVEATLERCEKHLTNYWQQHENTN